MKQLPQTTKKQLKLLLYLYQFNFLNTNQFQKLCHHKQPQTVQKWLKDLKDKQYLTVYDFERNKFIANTKPTIYSLTKLARKKLKTEPKCELEVLNSVYRIKSLSKTFIYKCIFLADIYIKLLSQIGNEEKLHFSTKANLKGFDYLPSPLPEAYIAIKKPNRTKRYFLFLLDIRLPLYLLDKKIKNYIEYTESNNWESYSSNPLPSFLIICPNKGTQKHLYKIISDEIPDTSFYLTTKDTIQEFGFKGDVWEKVKT